VCCSVMQCGAVCCCSVVAVCSSVLQCVVVQCLLLQWVAACCSVFQCVAVRMCCSVCYCIVLQCVAVCCSVLQCVAVSQCVAESVHEETSTTNGATLDSNMPADDATSPTTTRCNTLQHIATHKGLLPLYVGFFLEWCVTHHHCSSFYHM